MRRVGVVAVTASLAALAACDEPVFPPADEPLGRVVATRTEPASQGRTRVIATVEDADGRRWTVRLSDDTRCAPSPDEPPPATALYPGCAELP